MLDGATARVTLPGESSEKSRAPCSRPEVPFWLKHHFPLKLAASTFAIDLPQKIKYNSLIVNGGFMLVGREKETNMLLSAIRSDKSEFVAVFGRRRVGKTNPKGSVPG